MIIILELLITADKLYYPEQRRVLDAEYKT